MLKDYTWKEYKQLSSSMGSSGEIPIMRMYVERMTGYKDLDALKITYYMMKEMAKRATSGGFDVYNAPVSYTHLDENPENESRYYCPQT